MIPISQKFADPCPRTSKTLRVKISCQSLRVKSHVRKLTHTHAHRHTHARANTHAHKHKIGKNKFNFVECAPIYFKLSYVINLLSVFILCVKSRKKLYIQSYAHTCVNTHTHMYVRAHVRKPAKTRAHTFE